MTKPKAKTTATTENKTQAPVVPAWITVGYTTVAMEDLDQYVAIPTAEMPKSITTEAGKKKWDTETGPQKQAELEAKAREEAAHCKLTGRLTRVWAVDPQPSGPEGVSQTFDSDAVTKHPPAVSFLLWLLKRYPSAFPATVKPGSGSRGVILAGFDIKEFVRIAGVETCLAGKSIPRSFWYGNDDCYDPYDMLVEDGRRKFLPVESVARMAGIDIPEGWTPHADPREDARIASELITRFSLADPATTVSLAAIIEEQFPMVQEEVAEETTEEAAEETAEETAEEEQEYVEEGEGESEEAAPELDLGDYDEGAEEGEDAEPAEEVEAASADDYEDIQDEGYEGEGEEETEPEEESEEEEEPAEEDDLPLPPPRRTAPAKAAPKTAPKTAPKMAPAKTTPAGKPAAAKPPAKPAPTQRTAAAAPPTTNTSKKPPAKTVVKPPAKK